MLKLAFRLLVRLFVLWRRNDAISIAFKTAVLGGFSWLVAREFGNAIVAHSVGIATAVVSLVHYTLKNRREHALLVKHLDGNAEAARAIKKKFAKSGAAGAMLHEVMRDSIRTEEELEDIPELTGEQMAANRRESQTKLDRVLELLDAHPELEIPEREARVLALSNEFASDEGVCSTTQILTELLEERSISLFLEGFCDYDDHAGVVEIFSQATGGMWNPTGCTSSMDDEGVHYTVRFNDDDGQEQKWRFHQNGDWLSPNFLKTLIRHTERQSGWKLLMLETDECFTGILLPPALYEALVAAGVPD